MAYINVYTRLCEGEICPNMYEVTLSLIFHYHFIYL